MTGADRADNTLAYIDQASFLGLRALGRGPLIQFTWIYEHPVDFDALARFQRNLGGGMLGRVIERSPLPFSRHRWVHWQPPAVLEVDNAAGRDAVPDWLDRRLALPVDPEHGPPWRLGVLPLSDGGAAVSLVVSHTVGDGIGISIAVAEAVEGILAGPHYPSPKSRRRVDALRQDIPETLRAAVVAMKALPALVRTVRHTNREAPASSHRAPPLSPDTDGRALTVPSATLYVEAEQWDEQAKRLGGTSNSLFLGFAARLGEVTGRISPEGTVLLAVPVNERTPGDRRGNAISGVDVIVEAAAVTGDLSGVRRALKTALSSLPLTRERLAAPLPLTPFVPGTVVRRLEGRVLGNAAVVGCSGLGEVDPSVNRPDGTEAELFSVRSVESAMTVDEVRRIGGLLFLVAARVRHRQSVSICYADPAASSSRAQLVEIVRNTLGDFGLTGTVE